MSAEWTLKPALVEEHLQTILADLKKENKDPSQSVDIVRERLIAALQPPPIIKLSVEYVTVTFSANYIVAKTVFFETKHYEGNCNGTASSLNPVNSPINPLLDDTWGGASTGFMTTSKDGHTDYIANNTQDMGRGGNLQVNFLDGDSSVGYVSFPPSLLRSVMLTSDQR